MSVTDVPTELEKDAFQHANVEIIPLSTELPETWSVEEIQKLRNSQRKNYVYGTINHSAHS